LREEQGRIVRGYDLDLLEIIPRIDLKGILFKVT
jgi:hypothetical protein